MSYNELKYEKLPEDPFDNKNPDEEDPMRSHHVPEESSKNNEESEEKSEENSEENSEGSDENSEESEEFIDEEEESIEVEEKEIDLYSENDDDSSNSSEKSGISQEKSSENPEEILKKPSEKSQIPSRILPLEIESDTLPKEESQPFLLTQARRMLIKMPEALEVAKPSEPLILGKINENIPKEKLQKKKPDFKVFDFGKDEKTPSNPLFLGLNPEKSEGFFSQLWKSLKFCCVCPDSQEKVSIKTNEIQRQFSNRVTVRYCCVVLIPFLLLSIFFCLYFFTKDEGNFSFPITKPTNININMTRCMLILNEKPENFLIKGSFYVTLSISALYNETLSQSSSEISYDEDLNELNISVISVKDNMKSCHLYVNLPEKYVETLTIQCFERCFITQEFNEVSVGNLRMFSDEDIYTNFRRISANELVFSADKGILQINSFQISSKAEINLNYGDIILQSESDIQLNWENAQKAYCFASPFITHETLESCETSNDTDANTDKNLKICQGKSLICISETCLPNNAVLSTRQLLGNLYVNRIETPFIDIEYTENYTVSKGDIYSQGVSFEPFVLAGVEKAQEKAKETNTDAIFIVELGKKYLQSQGNSFWTVISNPSFAYIRPWWLATFSLSLLTANSFTISGYLSPGLCPYHIEYNRDDIYEVQSYLSKFFALNNSVVSYIDETFNEKPGFLHKNGTGFYQFEKDRPISEKWFSVILDQEAKLDVISNDISANGFILAALILSFLFAGFVGFTAFFIFKAAIMITYQETLEKATHTRNYVNFIKIKDENAEKKKRKRINIQGLFEESSFSNFMQEVPRLSAFVGFYSLNLVRKYFIDSVAEFLAFLMNPQLESEVLKANKGIGETRYLMMKERVLKNYYEKFCFLNGLTEKGLSDSENMKKIEEYGYELIDEEEVLSKAFTKMQLLEDTVEIDKNSLDNMDSLDVFITNCVKTTNSETDTEFIDEFIEKFNVFCDKYRLKRKEVRIDELSNDIKYKFGITIITRKKLVRKTADLNELQSKAEKPVSLLEKFRFFLMKIVTFGRFIDKKSLRGKFLIDETMMNYHFDVILQPEDQKLFEDLEKKLDEKDKGNEALITKKEVINKMIYHSYWYYWILMDVVMIFIQQLVTAMCIMPFFFLVLLQEITYSPYSIIDPASLITE